MYKHYARKLTGSKWNPRILLDLGAALVTGAVLYYIDTLLHKWGWLQLIGIGLIGLDIYEGFLALLKEFTKKNLKLFLDILNPKGRGRYVAGELKNNEKQE